ncbi:MAG: TetR/AcrR family transcriptional regulator [Pseudomonadota bacterium]
MEDRDLQILRAALTVFAKFGVAKTTMSDIAAEAGVARQTVYNAFPGKPELLRGAVRLAYSDVQGKIRERWQTCKTLGDKIDVYFDLGPRHWFEMVRSSPQLAELLDGMTKHAAEELAEGKKLWQEMFVEMFEAAGQQPLDADVTLQGVAEFLFSYSTHAKHQADSLEVLDRRLLVIKAAVLRLLG